MLFKQQALVGLIAAAALSASAPSMAWGLGSVTGALSGGHGGGANLVNTQTKTIADYVIANQLITVADAKMAKALGLESQAVALNASSKALKAGTSEGSIKKSDKAISTATAMIADKLKQHPKLSSASKREFGLGLASLTAGSISYVKVAKDVSAASSQVSSASPMQLMKIGTLVYMVKTVPGNVSHYTTALKAALAFAHDNKIPAPSNAGNATAALGALG